MSTHALTRHPTPSFKAQSHAAVNNPDLRQSFGGAMDFLQAKRASQFPDPEGFTTRRWRCSKHGTRRAKRTSVTLGYAKH